MLKRIVQLFIIIAGGTTGFLYFPSLVRVLGFTRHTWLDNPYIAPYVGLFLGAIILYLLSFWLVDYIVQFIQFFENLLLGAPLADLFFGSVGLILGLVIAYIINQPIQDIQIIIVSQIIPLFTMGLLGYLGFQVGFKRRDEFANILTLARKDKEQSEASEEEASKVAPKAKLLDTSVIIDGRIADICQTHFLEGTIIIPHFVLEELQHIADSSDALKRNRGRRGLDVLNRLQKEIPVDVEMYDGDFEDIQEVDSKLVKLAKVSDGIVVTNDFNLNKVCEFQNVPVLNINDLANAVKPVVLPGEQLVVQVIKDGKEQNQGVAYLDDGTMIVVEEGRHHIGESIEVIITSVLQTSAGRMIFAKPKALEKAQ
ncbi:PIN/TRAM domain-containing protein [Pelagirhabdus alkalitolerans]|uniref:PIN/TRAM domain-containing protein n=1 Tax=Pelagirhabdus alkalitolerans TaxID=1612202 RepID=UPI000B854EF7|nr:PIN/TRAM domain-containing protein [Pelagirhabdus alkalitolerans]